MVAFLRVELAGSDDFGQLLHVGRFDVHYIKRLIRYLHMPKVNPENKEKFRLYDKVFRKIALSKAVWWRNRIFGIIIFDSSIVKNQ